MESLHRIHLVWAYQILSVAHIEDTDVPGSPAGDGRHTAGASIIANSKVG